eukprot:TRINITY_DN16560_c0_g1_i1.p1 TRINITY_DN16560_c0_g1~~TRINITY_DN16560_c0_g1_i1.p1  ORF type:complete len:482 (-),score=57.29 TRINITY_DN16560_c0_g1_i1:105-1508(-)
MSHELHQTDNGATLAKSLTATPLKAYIPAEVPSPPHRDAPRVFEGRKRHPRSSRQKKRDGTPQVAPSESRSGLTAADPRAPARSGSSQRVRSSRRMRWMKRSATARSRSRPPTSGAKDSRSGSSSRSHSSRATALSVQPSCLQPILDLTHHIADNIAKRQQQNPLQEQRIQPSPEQPTPALSGAQPILEREKTANGPSIPANPLPNSPLPVSLQASSPGKKAEGSVVHAKPATKELYSPRPPSLNAVAKEPKTHNKNSEKRAKRRSQRKQSSSAKAAQSPRKQQEKKRSKRKTETHTTEPQQPPPPPQLAKLPGIPTPQQWNSANVRRVVAEAESWVKELSAAEKTVYERCRKNFTGPCWHGPRLVRCTYALRWSEMVENRCPHCGVVVFRWMQACGGAPLIEEEVIWAAAWAECKTALESTRNDVVVASIQPIAATAETEREYDDQSAESSGDDDDYKPACLIFSK